MTEEAILSVVVLLEKEDDFNEEAFGRIVSEISNKYNYYEFVVVFNNENSLNNIKIEQQKIKHLRILRLTRSLPCHAMLLAGLDHCIGDIVAVLKLGEVVPNDIPVMLENLKNNVDIVFGIEKEKKISLLKWACVSFFGILVKALTKSELTFNRSFFMALNRRAVLMVGSIKFKSFNISRVVDEIGLESCDFYSTRKNVPPVKWHDVLAYSKICIKAIVYDSLIPLRLSIFAGVCGGSAALFYGFYTAIIYLFKAEVVPGWTTTNIMNSGFFTLVFFSLAILGEYLGRVLDEVKRRPPYFLKDEVGCEVDINDLTKINVVEDSI